LLVATITLLSELFDHSKCRDVQKPQVCLASATNVAVDNVLLALQRAGYQDFARVGSVKKIAKSILPVAAHAAGPETTRAIADMKFMMAASGRNAVSGAEREAVADAISKLESKKNRSEELMSRRVIGVTCAATAVAVLEHRRFAVVLLDEASQMVEPASLLSVARFAARRLLAVGDPLQLPPTLPSSPVYRSESADAAGGHSLERTLFERLAQNGSWRISNQVPR
jgi:AAA domain